MEEKWWRFDSEVGKSRRHNSILFFLLGKLWGRVLAWASCVLSTLGQHA